MALVEDRIPVTTLAGLVTVVVLLGLAKVAPVWTVVLLAAGVITLSIYFLLLFGPAEPLGGYRSGGE
jgi:hypothetical protein